MSPRSPVTLLIVAKPEDKKVVWEVFQKADTEPDLLIASGEGPFGPRGVQVEDWVPWLRIQVKRKVKHYISWTRADAKLVDPIWFGGVRILVPARTPGLA